MSMELLLLAAKKAAASTTYATRNPSDKSANITLSGGNLVATASNTAWKSVRATIWKSTWKWYREHVQSASWWWNAMVWVGTTSASLSSFCGSNSSWWSYYSYIGKLDWANKFYNNVNSTYGNPYTLWDVIWIALDAWAGTVEFFKNNVSQGTMTWLSWTLYPIYSPYDNAIYGTTNFGATAMTYSPPTWYNTGLYT